MRAVAGRYVGVLGTEGMDEYKDFFFKHYPFLVANAVFWGFHYLCPGSRHLYSNAFKRVLYLQCARILSGIEVGAQRKPGGKLKLQCTACTSRFSCNASPP